MFEGRKLRGEVERLEGENQQLHDELNAIKQSPAYHLAQDILRMAEELVDEVPLSYTEAFDGAFAKLRREFIAKYVAYNAEEDAQEAIEQKSDEIRQEAEKEVEGLVREAVEDFLRDEAPELRKQIREQSAGNIVAAVAIARSRTIQEEVKSLNSVSGKPENRKSFKKRAEALLEQTRNSHILPLDQLKDGDYINLAFADTGHGFDLALSNDDSLPLGSARNIECRVLDKQMGVVEIQSDSWLRRADKRGQALRRGRMVIIGSEHPDTGEVKPILVKGQNVLIRDEDCEELGDAVTDLWCINLNDFRVMT